jgi:hypothetical protein
LYDVVADGQGGWFVAGPFSSIGGVARSYLAQIDSTGNVTSWNPNPNATVYDIELVGNNVIAAGDFYTIGGQTRPKASCYQTFIQALLPAGHLHPQEQTLHVIP